MKIGVLIPTRDRPLFLSHAMYLLENQTLQPDFIEIVDEKTNFNFPDVTWRYKTGIERLRNKCDLIICWEDDDWYHHDYIKTMVNLWTINKNPDFIGINSTIYYHIVERIYVELKHSGRSSMMSMAIKSDAELTYCKDDYQYLDYHLWTTNKNKKIAVKIDKPINVGIKHGIGKIAGGGHTKLNIYNKKDLDLSFLKSIVKDKESILFYERFFKTR